MSEAWERHWAWGWKLGLMVAVMTLNCFVSVRTAAACSIAPADPWFTEAIHIGDASQSQMIGLKTTDSGLEISNRSTSNLYILVDFLSPSDARVEASLSDIPDGKSLVVIPPEAVVGYDLVSLSYWDQELTLMNVEEPNRPENVEIPAPQQTQLEIISEEESFIYPLEIRYALNEQYDPAYGSGDCGDSQLGFWLTGIILFLTVILAAGFLLVRMFFLRRK